MRRTLTMLAQLCAVLAGILLTGITLVTCGNLIMRKFGQSESVLVASPSYLDRMGRPQHPEELMHHKTLSHNENDIKQQWALHGPQGRVLFDIKPQVIASSFSLLGTLAEQGEGIAFLPLMRCIDQIKSGKLEVVLSDWRLPQGIYHAVFASRRGMLPAVRVFIDFLAEKIPPMLQELHANCPSHPAERQA